MRKNRSSQDYAIHDSHNGQYKPVLVTGRRIDYVGRPARAGQRAGCHIVSVRHDDLRDVIMMRRS